MAATPTLLTNGTATGNPGTTASVSPTSGRLLELDVIAASGSPETIISDDMTPSGLSATWVLVDFELYGQRRAMWRFRCQSDGTSGTIGLTYGAPDFAEMAWALKEWGGQVAGNNGADAVGTPVSGETGFDSILTLGTVGALSAGDAVSAMFGIESDAGAGVITGYTELVDQVGGNENIRQMLVGWDDADVTASASWSGASSAGGIANRIIAGTSGVTGTLAVTEAADTLAAAGTVTVPAITGTLAVTEAADTLAASGTTSPPASTGTLSVTEQADTLAATGAVTIPSFTGELVATEAPDTLAASGAVVNPGIAGSLAVTEQPDTLAASGAVTVPAFTGTLSATEAADTLAAAGTHTAPAFSGTLAVTEASDTLAAAGTVVNEGIAGSLSVTEAVDVLVAAGTVEAPPTTLAVSATDTSVSAVSAGRTSVSTVAAAAESTAVVSEV